MADSKEVELGFIRSVTGEIYEAIRQRLTSPLMTVSRYSANTVLLSMNLGRGRQRTYRITVEVMDDGS